MTDLIQRELDLAASPAEVWAALTNPDWLGDWLADEVAMDLRPGGEARFRTGEEIRSGWVEEVSPPRPDDAAGSGRLAFWWAVDGDVASRVELSVIPCDAGTRLRVVETRPLQVLDLVGIPLSGNGGHRYGPALVAA